MMLAVQSDHLKKHFGKIEAVQSISMSVPTGSTYGLVGANGAGKTTLFSILCGLLFPSGGKAKILDVPINKWRRLYGRVGIMPQDARLYAFRKVRDNLRYFARLQGFSWKQARSEVSRVLEIVDMTDWAGTHTRKLSHGMAKRINLAQSLIGNPEILFLDEPTAGLDPVHANAVRDLIRSMKTRTIIISSHNLEELEDLCSHVGIMDKGKLIAEGPVKEITRVNKEVTITGVFTEAHLKQAQSLEDVQTVHLTDCKLHITFSEGTPSPEKAVTRILGALIEQGATIIEVHRGGRLMDKYLELL